MLRSRKQQAAAAAGSNTNGSGSSSSSLSSSSLSLAHSKESIDVGRRRNSKSPSSSIIPKSLIGTVIVFAIGLLLFVLLFDGGGGGGGGGEPPVNNSINAPKVQQQQLRNSAATNNNPHNKSSKTTTTAIDTIGTTSPTTKHTLHIIFSTDCGTYQHWQSYLFFHRAYTIHQPGYITRIASGCTEQQLQYEQLWHDTRIAGVMSDRYRIHFTPHFSGVKDEDTGEVKGDYKFFNKPFGLKHFLEHDELLGLSSSSESSSNNNNNDIEMMKHPDDVIILCDPDFALLRPITDDFSNARETLVGQRRKKFYDSMSSHIVTHGHPYAQTYGLGTQWRKFNLDDIAGSDSPAKEVSQQDGGMFYPAGPPYIGTASDMYKIANKWSEFAPRVHKEYPHLLAEMVRRVCLYVSCLILCFIHLVAYQLTLSLSHH